MSNVNARWIAAAALTCLWLVCCPLAAADRATPTPAAQQALHTVTIVTDSPGLTPDEVERQLSHPIESVLGGLADVVAVRSASSAGRSTVWVDFPPGADLHAKRQAVAQRMRAGQASLPPGARPILAPAIAREGDVTFVAVSDDTLDGIALRVVAESRVRPRLLTVPGVAEVTIRGGRLPVYEVIVAPDKLLAFDLPLPELIAAVAKVGRAPKGGVLKLPEEEVIVRIGEKGVTTDDIAGAVVSTRAGRPVLVRDVAAVTFGGSDAQGAASVWLPTAGKAVRHSAIILAVRRSPGTKNAEVTAAIGRVIEQVQAALPPSLRMTAETFGRRDLVVALHGPVGGNLERWRRVAERAEDIVARVPGVQSVVCLTGGAGRSVDDGIEEPSATQMFVRLAPDKREEIAADIRRALRELPGITASIAAADEPTRPDAPATRGRLVLKVLGPDLAQLGALAEQAQRRLAPLRGVVDLHVDPSGASPQLQIDIDRQRVAVLGIAAGDVAEVAQTAWLGRMVGQVVHEGQRRDVWVKLDERSRASPDVIGKTLVAAPGGKRVPLSSLVTVRRATGPRVIYRENGQRRMLVACHIEGRKPSEVVAAAKRELAGLEVPRGYTLVWDEP